MLQYGLLFVISNNPTQTGLEWKLSELVSAFGRETLWVPVWNFRWKWSQLNERLNLETSERET